MEVLTAFVPGYALTVIRVTAMIVATFLFGTTGETRWPRLILAIGLSTILFLRAPVIVDPGPSPMHFGLVAAREVILGLAIGFSVQMILVVLRIAGALLGHEMGFSMSQIVDPTTGIPSPVMGRFFETLSLLFLLSIDGHHVVFRIFAETFERIPVGASYHVDGLVQSMGILIADGLHFAISLAAPVYAVLILLTVVLVVLARAVPQIHLMEFGYAVRILLALVTTLIFMSTAAPYIYRMFDDMFAGVRNVLAAAAA